MKLKMIFTTAALLISTSALAGNPQQPDFSQIRLEGLQVLDSTQTDTFGYKIKKMQAPNSSLVADLESESDSKVVSSIYELDEASHFKNIYVYIGLTEEGEYELVEVLVNSRGSVSVIDMTIVGVSKAQLKMVQGPSDEQETYIAQSRLGNLFP